MSWLTISDLSPRHQAEASRQINVDNGRLVKAKPKRLRQSSTNINKTESEFSLWLREYKKEATVYDQSITLRLANGCRYTPDFVAVERATTGYIVTAYEVKGYMRDDAAVKIKVAASIYNWVNFVLVTRDGRRGWRMEDVFP